MKDELMLFVREALARGLSKDEIRAKLLEARWPKDEVDNALDAFADIEFPIPVPRPKPYLSAREAFVYLVLFTTLYTSAIGFGALVFEFINRAFPDPAVSAFGSDRSLRWSSSSLIIAFPVFLLLSRATYRAIRQDPEKRTSKIRKWLTYLTLFVAAAILLGDLVTLVFNLLGGELTTRFVLKVLTVGGVAGAVFSYYLWDLRQDDAPVELAAAKHPGVRAFVGAVVAAVAAGIVGSLILVGSPGEARLTRLDDRRERDLQMVSMAIDLYWSLKGELPPDLERLARERGVRVRSIRDPETGEPYEYRITGEQNYELCAVFDREDTVDAETAYPYGPYTPDRFWSHGAGRHCFDVEVRSRRS